MVAPALTAPRLEFLASAEDHASDFFGASTGLSRAEKGHLAPPDPMHLRSEGSLGHEHGVCRKLFHPGLTVSSRNMFFMDYF